MGTIAIMAIPRRETLRVLESPVNETDKLRLIADICRFNAFNAVKCAGSGHLGSSLSAMDIFVHLYFREMNILRVGIDSPDRDIFFSSKGHDCPGMYAALVAAGVIEERLLWKLRRLGGLDGHPDVHIPGVEANSGSLGMGISKAKGMAKAIALAGRGGRVFVMTGDGELHEGQIWESLQTTAHQRIANVTVIVDHNEIQSDKRVSEIVDLRDLRGKFEAFGWHVEECDGNNMGDLQETFARIGKVADRPKVIIANTVKGKGISFMEGPQALEEGGGFYRWHAGAPDDDAFERGRDELLSRINARCRDLGLGAAATEIVETRERRPARLKETAEKVVTAYGEALAEIGGRRRDIVVLDADLAEDCGLRPFERRFPERFLECGIAEQDMVSAAGGLALQGFLPIVNSFGVFLASRANEQIYANATEKTKIVYVCHYAGLIPAGPGKSHQSLRDISLFGALPNCVSVEPCNAEEARRLLAWCVDEAKENCHLRLVIAPSPRTIPLPADDRLQYGRGTVLREGKDVVLFGYGPVLLHEALLAADLLAKANVAAKVVNLPWLNRADREWVEATVGACGVVAVLDNHAPVGGLGDHLVNLFASSDRLRSTRIRKLAVEGAPACGTPPEVLRHHRLDGESIARRILDMIAGRG